jgi:membrane associated rhomboid family serine protease
MFPYRDDNPTLGTSVVTFALIGLNLAVWVLVQGMGAEPYLSKSVCELGLIPGEFLGRLPPGYSIPMGPATACVMDAEQEWFSPLSSMFLHGGWLHLIGNMWFLWLFGNNVEDSMGHVRYLVFYLLSGLAAAAAQTLVNPNSAIPMVGASGAISGVMGAYIVLYPRVRVHMLVVLGFFITRIAVPAFLMLGYWFLLQILGGLPAIGEEKGGVAFWAHAGGFIAGALLILLFKDDDLVTKHRALARTIEHGLGYRERYPGA